MLLKEFVLIKPANQKGTIFVTIGNFVLRLLSCVISGICKSKAIKLLQNIDLTEKVEHYEPCIITYKNR